MDSSSPKRVARTHINGNHIADAASDLRARKSVYYLPWPAWPANMPKGCELPTKGKQGGIYAGNLIPFKNTQAFEWVLPLILQKTPTERFTVVGSGSHVQIVKRLKQQFGDVINYIPRLTRCEVIKLISDSYYALDRKSNV